ncbi:hypothetical protein LAZ67_7001593 [Cordylochernes scorpioides]|uniref:Uncharacterized protein n=1 Tax=Cordylochernes scorpioides TaxID=51811 RepID=A0ABY6KMF0_9ARAC|nr:hypothetical protein LAZ67_7001593 [Cordylochernes scorpioides]
MANHMQIAAPEGFNFCKPNEWPIWFKRFQRYRIASGLSEKSEDEQFNRRGQGDSEPVEEFLTNLYVLAENCNYGILKEEIIRYRLVVEVKNFQLSEILQLESVLTLEKAIQIVRQSENVKNQQKEIRQGTENRNVDALDKKGGRNGTFFQKTRLKGTKTIIKDGLLMRNVNVSDVDITKDIRRNIVPLKMLFETSAERKVCHTKTIQEVSSSQDNAFIGIVGKLENTEDKWCEVIKVNDQPIKFIIDTGSEVSVMPEEIYLQYFGYLKTEKADKNIFAVSKKIEVNGMFLAFLESKRQKCKENIYIVKGVARPLLSCRASEILGLVRRLNIVEDHAPTKLDPMLKFPKLFTGLGKIDIPIQILRLQIIRYSYKIIHTPGNNLIVADALSRSPRIKVGTQELEEELCAYVQQVVSFMPISDVRVIQNIIKYTQDKWPERTSVSMSESQYWTTKDEFSVENGILLKESRYVIPENIRKRVAQRIHEGHLGIVKCRERAKGSVW